MPLRLLFLSFLTLVSLISGVQSADEPAADTVRIVGSIVVVKPFTLAAPVLRDQGFQVKVNAAEGGSSAVIAAAGEGKVDIALSTRPLAAEDRAGFPAKFFHESAFAIQALALIVPKDVWEGGVRALSRKQIRSIYEKEITNWKEVGGANQPIKFYNPAQGRGVWEFFAVWLYGEQRKAPLGERFDAVADSEEARNIVEFNAGAISIAPPGVADHKAVFALAIRDDAGPPVEPTVPNIRSGKYSFQRSLYMVTSDRPTGDVKKIIEFMRGAEGQALVDKSELVSLDPQ